MSAYIVTEPTMQRAIHAILDTMPNHDRTFDGQDLSTNESINALGMKLYGMNADAVGQRYSTQDLPGAAVPYRFVFDPTRFVDKVDGFKALQCLLYQCSEGDVPEKVVLFKKVQEAAADLAAIIVRALPEYDRADWDSEAGAKVTQFRISALATGRR